MIEVDFIKFIFTAGIASLIGGGTGVLIVVFLSKKLLGQLLNKDIEKYKSKLSCKLKLDQVVNKYNFDEETKVIKEIWEHIENIVTCCAKYEENGDEDQLNSLNKNLKNNLSKNKPFIHESLEDLIAELIEISNIENYSSQKFQEVVDIREKIIKVLRKRLHLF